MEHGEMIHDFVDGTLDSGLENGLFVELASNQQLRSELKQFIEFERTARYDTAAYAPSAESTAGVFSRLGIPLPLAATAVVAPAATGVFAILGKYSQGLIGGVIAMLMTAGVMYFAVLRQAQDDSQQSSVDSRQSAVVSRQSSVFSQKQSPLASNDIPIIKSEEKVAPKVIEKVIIKYVDRPVYIEQSSIMDNGELVMDNEEVDKKKVNIETADIENVVNMPEVNLFSGINEPYNFNPIAVQEQPFNPNLGLFDYLGKIGISLEVTGSDYWMFPKDTMPKSVNPFLENTKLAMLIKLSEKWQAGVEVRQEYFYHEYKDNEYLYKQSNNYLTGNAFLRWNVLNYNFASVFGQASYGANIGGHVGRFMLGTLIKPSSDYSFIIGLEYSGMLYNHNNTPFLASKFGLNYGMMFNF
ncbi:MAG: hypothetical protein V1779_02640 [bacterium]